MATSCNLCNEQKFSLTLACKRDLSARDRDEIETFKIRSRDRLEAETLRPRLHPWSDHYDSTGKAF